MVIAWNHGLARIVANGTVQPDPELLGETLRSRCGELHEVRLTGRRDHIWLHGTLALCPPRTRLDYCLSLGYGFCSHPSRLVGVMRGRGSPGTASPCQGEGRGFESRRPLGASLAQSLWGAVFPRWSGREARQRTANPCTRVQIPSPPRAIGAVGARFPDTEEVTGSNPVSPTSNTPSRGDFPRSAPTSAGPNVAIDVATGALTTRMPPRVAPQPHAAARWLHGCRCRL